ncbi:hypothetical protein [Streptomyces sp. ME19-01-6]|uniref:hypothetical protein n=1 Tax=Streptomyces sp. ME19-01-6 TaxID=3028686 RepID=UPI0029AB626F|nr:hypothetical protein [Streptomyces sp. ME19-01-6]MDX3231725.1 hypothetical protein [Streptomyces sp. ME19-01-6]
MVNAHTSGALLRSAVEELLKEVLEQRLRTVAVAEFIVAEAGHLVTANRVDGEAAGVAWCGIR